MNFNRTFVGYQGRKKYASESSTNTIVSSNGGNVSYTIIGGGESTGTTGDAYTKSETDTLLAGKQDTLVSGENICTINGESILGGGDLTVTAKTLTITPMGADLIEAGTYPDLNVGIGELPVAKVDDGIEPFYLSSIDREWYKIDLYKEPAHAIGTYPIQGLPQDLIIKFENYDTRLWDNPRYRVCLMEWKRDTQKRWHWAIPMITPRWDSYTGEIVNTKTTSRYEFSETYTPIEQYDGTPGQIRMFDTVTGKTWADILPIDVEEETMNDGITKRYRFRNGHSNKLFGFAVFKYYPNKDVAGFVQSYQWARVSNIAKLRVTVDKNGYRRARVQP